jgi:hypothetical protein
VTSSRFSERYFEKLEAKALDRSERWSEREEVYRNAALELEECERRVVEINERVSQ